MHNISGGVGAISVHKSMWSLKKKSDDYQVIACLILVKSDPTSHNKTDYMNPEFVLGK